MSDKRVEPKISMVPDGDRETQYATGNNRPARGSGGGGSRSGGSAGGGGTGILARLMITVALVVAAVACAWAWQLQQQLVESERLQAGYEARLADMEARLADTDEGMNQSATLQAAKIRELDTEVRKLWDNVWKKSKERFAVLERDSKSHAGKIAANSKSLSTATAQLKTATADLTRLKTLAADLQRLSGSAKSNQAQVERVADDINRLSLDLARLDKRVVASEEWLGSVNAFRRQVNASISDIQTTLRNMNAPP